jgi:hypothetical protein
VCGVSLRKWNAIRDRLISLGKIIIENELLSNSRADFEILSADLSSRERAESGAKGGRKRAEKEAAAKETNDLAQAELKPIEKIREEKKEGETNVSPRGQGFRLPDDWEPENLGLRHHRRADRRGSRPCLGCPRSRKLQEPLAQRQRAERPKARLASGVGKLGNRAGQSRWQTI